MVQAFKKELFSILIIFVIVIGLDILLVGWEDFVSLEYVNINIHDTYYVFENYLLIWFLTSLFFGIVYLFKFFLGSSNANRRNLNFVICAAALLSMCMFLVQWID